LRPLPPTVRGAGNALAIPATLPLPHQREATDVTIIETLEADVDDEIWIEGDEPDGYEDPLDDGDRARPLSLEGAHLVRRRHRVGAGP
jgi:hypothetical protein